MQIAKQEKGYSLLELLIVTAIIGVICLIFISQTNNLKTKINSNADHIKKMIDNAMNLESDMHNTFFNQQKDRQGNFYNDEIKLGIIGPLLSSSAGNDILDCLNKPYSISMTPEGDYIVTIYIKKRDVK